VSLAGEFRGPEGQLRLEAQAAAPPRSDYAFLLGRFIDHVTLSRAHALAEAWGVQPHEVMIANGWIGAEEYYRALAESCGIPFRPALAAEQVARHPQSAAMSRQGPAQGAGACAELRLFSRPLEAHRIAPNAGAASAVQVFHCLAAYAQRRDPPPFRALFRALRG
jgi:hypothetical protein